MSVAVDAGVLATWRATSRVERALLLGTFVNKLGGFLQIFLVLFLVSQGFTAVQAGVALGTYGAGNVVGVLIGGWVSDRLGARAAISGSMAATAVLLVSVLHVHRYEQVLVVVGAVGAIGQFYRPAAATMLAELTAPQRQVMVFAMSRLALNLGTTAAPLLGAVLIGVSYDLLFWCEALAAVAFAALALTVLGPRAGRPDGASPPGPSSPTPDDVTAPDELPPTTDPEQPVPADGAGGYLTVVRDRRFVAYLVAVLVNAIVYSQYLSTLPLSIRDRGLGPVWYSVVVAVNGAVVITCELAMTRVVSRWPRRRVVRLGFVLLGAGLAVYGIPAGPWLLVVGTLLWSLAEIIEGPTMFAYPAQAAPGHLRGRYVAAFQAVFSVGTAIAPVLGVFAYQAVGDPVWFGFGLLSVVALAPGLYGLRPEAARSTTSA